MEKLDSSIDVKVAHGLNYNEIPMEELMMLNEIVMENTMGEESMISMLDNLIDNSNEEKAEELTETRETLINKIKKKNNGKIRY